MDPLTTFLCRDDADRGRLLELERPLRRARLLSYASCGIAVIAVVASYLPASNAWIAETRHQG